MKQYAVFVLVALAVLSASLCSAGDVRVTLDDAAGGSAFEVLNSQSNAILKIGSDLAVRLGEQKAPVLDQMQWQFGGHVNHTNAWQSFRVGRNGRLARLIWWHNFYWTNVAHGTVHLFQGEGTNGPLLWSKAVVWNAYETPIDIDTNIIVNEGEMYTINVRSTNLYSGGSSGNPYPAGRSSYAPDYDYMFQTFVVPSEVLVSIPNGRLALGADSTNALLSVGGDVVVSGTVHAASFAGSGAGLLGVSRVQTGVVWSNVVLEIPHYTPFTLLISCGWPDQGMAHVMGCENDWLVTVLYTTFDPGAPTPVLSGAATVDEATTATLLETARFRLRGPGEKSWPHNLILEKKGTVEVLYRLIY